MIELDVSLSVDSDLGETVERGGWISSIVATARLEKRRTYVVKKSRYCPITKLAHLFVLILSCSNRQKRFCVAEADSL